MLLLDTHVLVWSRLGDVRLGDRARDHIEWAAQNEEAAVSAITFWELAMLHEKGRLRILADIRAWRATLLDDGLIEIPIDGDIGVRANDLVEFHPDPADRIIVATALAGHQLVTADERILGWPGNLSRLDART